MTPTAAGRAALFDMDGTLVDSTAAVERLWTAFADDHALDGGEVLSFAHGRQSRDTIARFLPGADAEALAAAYLVDELAAREGIVEVPGATAFVAAVAERVPVAVVTSAPRSLAALRLELAGIPAPAVLVTAEDVDRGKPDPDGYLLAARLLDMPIGECLALEDAEAGLLAARASGATTVVVGGAAGPAASGLLRLPDLRAARVTGTAGRVEVAPR